MALSTNQSGHPAIHMAAKRTTLETPRPQAGGLTDPTGARPAGNDSSNENRS